MLTPTNLATICLSHGQVLQTIEGMHIARWLNRGALDSVLKKFRRDYVPFSVEELDKPQWERLRYGYVHLIECVIAIKMMADGIAHRHIVSLLKMDRDRLRSQYVQAFNDAQSGLGRPLTLKHPDGREINIEGLYLDFVAQINELGVLSSPGPVLLDPWQALNRFMGFNRGMHTLPLIRLSDLAAEAVRVASMVPELKRGRKSS
jgi:hypothetical protein